MASSSVDRVLFDRDFDLHWQMTRVERLLLLTILKQLRPQLSIEIGTYKGGSLQVIAEHSRKVFSIDLDPGISETLGQRFPNVTFLSGPSKVSLRDLVRTLGSCSESPDFVLVDGDHSEEGVRNDLDLLLGIRPLRPMYVLMHDSYNPDCRRGMLSAGWAGCPFVQLVDIDFQTGRLSQEKHDTAAAGSMWGGLGLAILTPEKRTEALVIRQSQEMAVEAVRRISIHQDADTTANRSVSILRRVRRRIRQFLGNRQPK